MSFRLTDAPMLASVARSLPAASLVDISARLRCFSEPNNRRSRRCLPAEKSKSLDASPAPAVSATSGQRAPRSDGSAWYGYMMIKLDYADAMRNLLPSPHACSSSSYSSAASTNILVSRMFLSW